MSTATATKCSKPKGAYCRLHNPEPKGYQSAEEALQKAEQDFRKTHPGVSFQKPGETRHLPEGIPEKIADHIALSNQHLAHLSADEKQALAGYTGFAAGVCNSVLMEDEFSYHYYDEAPLWREADHAPCDFVSREELIDYMETIDTILAPRQTEQRVVYRGIPIYSSLHDEIGAKIGKKLTFSDVEGLMEGLKAYYKPGTVIKNEHYLSTTASAYYAADRSQNTHNTKKTYWETAKAPLGIVFELKTNAGLDVTGASRRNAYEREVVLPRETYFKVVSIDVKPAKYDTVSGFDNPRHPDDREAETFTNLAAVVQMVEVDKNGKEIHSTRPHHPERQIRDIIPE